MWYIVICVAIIVGMFIGCWSGIAMDKYVERHKDDFEGA